MSRRPYERATPATQRQPGGRLWFNTWDRTTVTTPGRSPPDARMCWVPIRPEGAA